MLPSYLYAQLSLDLIPYINTIKNMPKDDSPQNHLEA